MGRDDPDESRASFKRRCLAAEAKAGFRRSPGIASIFWVIVAMKSTRSAEAVKPHVHVHGDGRAARGGSKAASRRSECPMTAGPEEQERNREAV